MGMTELLNLAVEHEMGHALCSTMDEDIANQVAELLEKNQTAACPRDGGWPRLNLGRPTPCGFYKGWATPVRCIPDLELRRFPCSVSQMQYLDQALGPVDLVVHRNGAVHELWNFRFFADRRTYAREFFDQIL